MKEITLHRDCDAIQIPSGEPLILSAGLGVVITQALGGTYTVATPSGLARIAEKDADALGLTPSGETPAAPSSGSGREVDENEVWDRLKTVYDPEIPVNIVDLGLVYSCQLIKAEQGNTRVEIKMTLTAPGCGMGPSIAADAQAKVMSIDGVDEAQVDLVWDPAWNQSMISEEGRMKLGMV